MAVGGVARVSPSGRDLLLVARAIIMDGPYEATEGILHRRVEMHGVSANALRLFEETLARGCAQALARLGGWRRQSRVVSGRVETGRLWELRRESPLGFSPYVFELCRWLVREPLGASHVAPFSTRPTHPGDELVAYLACSWFEGQPLEQRLAEQPGLQASALAWLGFPGMLSRAKDGCTCDPARVDALVREASVVVEAVSDDLARRAVALERRNASTTSTAHLRAVGDARDRTLGLFVDALSQTGRWDLATFLVDATVDLRFVDDAQRLDTSASLRDRAEARRAAAAHFRHVVRLGRHYEELRQVRHFDEGYSAAQQLLSRWETVGSAGFARAAERATAATALDPG
jgi:hypothetical protein